MNTQPSYTLTSRSGTNPIWRRWALLAGNSLTVANLIADVIVIVAMSCLTGIGYHLVVYGERGDAASLSASACWRQHLRHRTCSGEYKLASLCIRQTPPRISGLERHIRVPARDRLSGQLTVVYSRGWMILFTRQPSWCCWCCAIVQITVSASAADWFPRGAYSDRPRQPIAAFLNRYELVARHLCGRVPLPDADPEGCAGRRAARR
jgi:hypothetical protein